jgi:hypothetical protein
MGLSGMKYSDADDKWWVPGKPWIRGGLWGVWLAGAESPRPSRLPESERLAA